MRPVIKRILILSLATTLLTCSKRETTFPVQLKPFISQIHFGQLGGQHPRVQYEVISDSLVKVSLSWILRDTLQQDDWRVNITPAFSPDFHWAPHLTPTDGHIIAQHVFRSPALIVSSPEQQLTLIPDLDILKKGPAVDWYMDIDAPANRLTLGLSHSQVKEHVLYTRKPGAIYLPGSVTFGFYIMASRDKATIFNPWRKVLAFLWEKWGQPIYNREYQQRDLEPYVKHTYNWAFNNWRQQVWQGFNLNGGRVGAPVFIVNVTQSPNYPGEVNQREFTSIWNQAWFSSLRSAQGLYRYARRTGNRTLLDYALKTKELALAFPQTQGFFPALIATEMKQVEKDGKKLNRSRGWATYYFGNSNRNPYTWQAREAPFHILDMSFTAYQMLTWYQELEKDARLLEYARKYADALMNIQDDKGFFPAWLNKETLKPMEHLRQSPETSMSVTFLLKLHEITADERYLQSALRAMDAVVQEIIPTGKWEDFETYWSCSRYGADHLVGKKVERNNMYKQNNFSMYWTAEALLNCYQITGNKNYLRFGQRTLDELLMTQASWQPPFIYVRTLGGFGVMNADGEWNDARQSLFAELIVKYGKVLNQKNYTQRGLAALRTSFEMMYCPENPKAKRQWEKKWYFFDEVDYGFMMENYGHGGVTSPEGLGMGEFTIYDWGNGAASEAYNRILDHYGKDFLSNN